MAQGEASVWTWAGLALGAATAAATAIGLRLLAASSTSPIKAVFGQIGGLDSAPAQAAGGILVGATVLVLVGWLVPALKAGKAARLLADDLETDPATSFTDWMHVAGLVTDPWLRSALHVRERDLEPLELGPVMVDSPIDPPQLALSGLSEDDFLTGRLNGWLYRRLPLALLAAGVVLALYAIARGLFFDLQFLGTTLGLIKRPVMEGLLNGGVALMLCTAGAVLCWVIYAVGAAGAGRSLNMLARLLGERQQEAGQTRLAQDVERAVRPSLDALTSAAARLVDDQVHQTSALMEKTVLLFIEKLASASGTQFEKLGETIAALHSSAEAGLAGIEATRVQTDSAITEQLRELNESYKSSVSSMQRQQARHVNKAVEDMRKMAEDLSALMTQTTQDLRAQAEAGTAATSQLVDVLRQETGGRGTIGEAAEQMATAARASRETVERFVALAERMRDLNKALASAPAGKAASAAAMADGPLADPDTARRLSSAIRDLQRATQEELPEL